MATVKDTTCQGGEMERKNYKDDGSTTRMNGLENTEMDHMIFRTT